MRDTVLFRRKNEMKGESCMHRIFCLPYAGAGASIYAMWQKYMGDQAEIVPVQLPGREMRIGEELISDCDTLVQTIYQEIEPKLTEDFSIFGHSMGGILAFELAHLIHKKKGIWPKTLFMSATTLDPEHMPRVEKMDDETLRDYLLATQGAVRELVDNSEFRRVYFPIIKNDYHLVEDYYCHKGNIGCPIYAFASKDDTLIPYTKTEKLEHYTNDFHMTYMTGNHFYVRNLGKQITGVMTETLAAVRAGA